MKTKTKLGLPVGLMGLICSLMGIYGGYVAMLLLTGYILICEKDRWLKSFSTGILLICLIFSLVLSGFGLFRDFVGIFNVDILNAIVNGFLRGIRIIGKLLVLGLGVTAVFGLRFRFPVVSKFFDNNPSDPE